MKLFWSTQVQQNISNYVHIYLYPTMNAVTICRRYNCVGSSMQILKAAYNNPFIAKYEFNLLTDAYSLLLRRFTNMGLRINDNHFRPQSLSAWKLMPHAWFLHNTELLNSRILNSGFQNIDKFSIYKNTSKWIRDKVQTVNILYFGIILNDIHKS